MPNDIVYELTDYDVCIPYAKDLKNYCIRRVTPSSANTYLFHFFSIFNNNDKKLYFSLR